MATEVRQLQLVLDLKDKATKELQGFRGQLDKIKPSLQKVAVASAAAFGAVAAGANIAINEAARAEGSYNKFNTVFGEHADDMMAFVKQIRKEMPSATHEIVRMSADLQDLLVPMGIARDEAAGMTKGFVDLANKLAAFNDEDPTQVLEAFKSGLAGSSEPLRRFGINALESSLEMEALNTGLIAAGQSFKDLDPVTRSQIRAQALLSLSIKQSSDAIEGFAENNDSYIRRQQSLTASINEFKVAIGTALLPAIDSALKQILPMVEAVTQWASENETLVKWIIGVTLAVTALIAVITGISLLMIAINPIVLGVVAVILLLGFTVMQIVKVMLLFQNHWHEIWTGIKIFMADVANNIIEIIENMINFIITGINFVIRSINSLIARLKSIPKIGERFADILKIPEIGDLSLGRVDTSAIVNNSGLYGRGDGGTVVNNNVEVRGIFGSDAAEEVGNMIIDQLQMANKFT